MSNDEVGWHEVLPAPAEVVVAAGDESTEREAAEVVIRDDVTQAILSLVTAGNEATSISFGLDLLASFRCGQLRSH